ncbi:MAG TPA: nicotinate-nucleotide adenylyltransferase [Actinobacteria bacterium]|jgi:nicotinate-nucleotide adenylyltransferase|nr:nicotinate-nucleotide adenylyltransferase [Actinomycetota bacterium]
MKIGIMGGTFNPIHHGHLVTAAEALNQFSLEKVIFIPSGDPPHKDYHEEEIAEHRYLMTVIATSSNSNFLVSRTEIDRKGKSYTIDTLKELKKTYGESAEFFFITGADAILEILTWKKTKEIINLCYMIAATRPGYNLLKLEELKKDLHGITGNNVDSRILVMEVPALAISSTDIRERVRGGRPIDYLVPEGVSKYIFKHGLYL